MEISISANLQSDPTVKAIEKWKQTAASTRVASFPEDFKRVLDLYDKKLRQRAG